MKSSHLDFIRLSKDILGRESYLRFQAQGHSMYPAIKDRDILNVERVQANQIRIGDVIFYKTTGGHMVCHRVVNKFHQNDRPTFLAKGDSNTGKAEEVLSDEVLGRVMTIERNGRVINLTHCLVRLIYIFLSKISPLIRIFKRMASRVLRLIHGLKIYRNLAKRLIRKEILYKFEPSRGCANHFLAKIGNKSVGKATVDKFLENNSEYYGWWIFGTWVNWRYRGLGIGKQLTMMVCDFVAKSGASDIKLLVFENNRPAINLYRKMGFSQISIPAIDEELRQKAKATRQKLIIMIKNVQKNS
ncbi:MAG: signal peptidase I [Candidatus Omnitrophota bacterium]|jgi:signal peptidase I